MINETEEKKPKICPIMTAGKVNPEGGVPGIPRQYDAKCREEDCGVWNPELSQCGFISQPFGKWIKNQERYV